MLKKKKNNNLLFHKLDLEEINHRTSYFFINLILKKQITGTSYFFHKLDVEKKNNNHYVFHELDVEEKRTTTIMFFMNLMLKKKKNNNQYFYKFILQKQITEQLSFSST